MSRRLLGVVLAGGASRRMGADKALLTHPDGSSWLEAQVQLLRSAGLDVCVMTGHDTHHALLSTRKGVTVQAEPWQPAGPLWALSCVLHDRDDEALLTLPVDMPGLRLDALQQLILRWRQQPARALVADDGSRLQHLFGIYPCGASYRKALDDELTEGKGRWRDWLGCIPHDTLKLPPDQLVNVNRPLDLKALTG
ncbi:Molybdenum cofactor guanylyltransferase [Synechococcus sp. MIT S9509]|uniref:molybdenum cofactor guanylyltransferase n=1 Tax=Synechococcus sp. MIT S9509 TaxID=1801630 RepID=UPI0007BC09E9|nr:molybdenum cofactor guanylyltransferase [Synechococcus sp. MIT S9509]KZR91805.1 Molybdenum cofactor guanylyltransferase [Synechococcus sp. MIT S9509]